MKRIFIWFFLIPGFLFGQNKNVSLLDHWSDSSLVSNTSQVRYSGCFAFNYQDREYGVIGSTEGTHVFEITDDNQLRFVDSIKGRYVSSQAITREFAHYGNYLYAIGDEGNASLQIIDLTALPNELSIAADIQDERVGRAHNIYIDSVRKLMYLCLVTPIINGAESTLIPLRVFSLETPLYPQLLYSGFDDLTEVHDLEVRDEIAILSCGFQGIRVYDFSDPLSPIYINNLEFYQEQGYNHQGSLSADGKTYVFADETPGTKIKRCAVSENYTIQVQQLFGVENEPYDQTAHNIEVYGNLAYVAYYNKGLRIYDLRTNPPKEIGSYDTHTDLPGNSFSMWGAWGINARLSNERVLVSDRISGLYLFEFDHSLFDLVIQPNEPLVYPNPLSKGEQITLRLPSDLASPLQIRLLNEKGAIIKEIINFDQSYAQLTMPFSSGTYVLELYHMGLGTETKCGSQKLIIK